MKNQLRNEIIRLTAGETWAMNIINQLVAEGMELLESGKATTVNQAAFKVIDARY
jgi:hypothetical protein